MVITNEQTHRRCERIRAKMRKLGFDALIVHSAPAILAVSTTTSGNVRYLTNFADNFMPSMLVLPLRDEPALLVYGPWRERLAKDMHIWVGDVRGEEDTNEYGSVAREVLRERGINSGRIGIVGRVEMAAPLYQGLTAAPCPWEFDDADSLVGEERVIKEPEEIEMHKAAAKISDTMLYTLMHGARVPGKWAWQLIAEAEWTGRSMFAEYATIWLATGPLPDFLARSFNQNLRQLNDGDRVQGGTFANYGGYWAHGLRMGIKGKPSTELQRYFDGILAAQEAGLKELRPGKRLKDAVKAMDAVIDEYCPYSRDEDPLRFHPGHGLGLNYYDPIVSAAFPQPAAWSKSGRTKGGWRGETDSDPVVKPGMVMELHPNFSVPEFGVITIGDVVLVTESGAELLTKFPRELYEV